MSSSKTDLIELIRISLFKSEQIDAILAPLIKHANIPPERLESVVETIKEQFFNDLPIDESLSLLEQTFSHEEIKNLLNIYRSSHMKKWTKHGQECFTPLINKFRQIVQQTLERAK